MDSEQQENIQIRVKTFLAKDSNFRRQDFDCAPYIITILKQNEANHESIINSKNQLIELQNECFDLINQVCIEKDKQFIRLLQTPQKYGQQLQKLKNYISIVKKKVKQTKSQLQNTQKDINNIYYSCLFNKIVYTKLKQLSMKLNQYQTAYFALKNNEFLLCSINLPFFNDNSILQSTLSVKVQNLKLQLLSKAIQQVNIFLFFTPKILTPMYSTFLQHEGQKEIEQQLNDIQHQPFFKRYNLFKEVKCDDYLKEIWKFSDLERKVGRIRTMYDILKGVINIGKISDIIEAIQIDYQKCIKNVFVLICYFFTKESKLENSKNNNNNNNNINNNQKNINNIKNVNNINSNSSLKTNQFINPNYLSHKKFISTILCLIGVLFRKMIIIRKILQQYEISELKMNSLSIYKLIKQELINLIKELYFPKKQKYENKNYNYIKQNIFNILNSNQNYILWGIIKPLLIKSIIICLQNLSFIQIEQFGNQSIGNVNELLNFIQLFDGEFYILFHSNFIKNLYSLFIEDCQFFNIQNQENIRICYNFSVEIHKIINNFSQQTNKCIKQYVLIIDLLQKMQQYFIKNNYQYTKNNNISNTQQNQIINQLSVNNDILKYTRYKLLILTMFYLKLNYYLHHHIITNHKRQKVLGVRKMDKKCRAKQKALYDHYYRIVQFDSSVQLNFNNFCMNKSSKQQHFSDFKLIERMRIIRRQNEMLLSYIWSHMNDVEQYKSGVMIRDYEHTIQKLQGMSYDDNFTSRIIRVWDQLPKSFTALNQFLTAIIGKFFILHLNICAFIYLQSGVY